MGLRFRRSVKLFPGVRLNVTKSGVSTTVGPRGLHATISSRRVTNTVGVPGTGLSITQEGPLRVQRLRTRLWVVLAVVVLLGAVLALAIAGSAHAQPPVDFSGVDARLAACEKARPNNDRASNCVVLAKNQVDRQLNSVYAGLVADLKRGAGLEGERDDPEILKRLVASERAWVAFRDAECADQSTVALGGTGEGYASVSRL